MNKKCYEPKVDLSGVSYVNAYPAFKQVEVEKDGRILHTSEYVLDDPSKRDDGKKPSDYALENILALGLPLSKDLTLTASRMSQMDALERGIALYPVVKSVEKVNVEPLETE